MTLESGRRALLTDLALACAVAAVLVTNALAAPGAGVIDQAAALCGSLMLFAARHKPLLALLVSTPCMIVYAVHVEPGPPSAFPVLVSVFAAVKAGHRVLPGVAGVAYLGSVAVDLGTSAKPLQEAVQTTGLMLGWFVAAVVAATVSRTRQAYLEQAEQRALEAERTRDEVARRRAIEERLRIARELHDSLTHSISVIKVQAGVAVHLARKRGEEVPDALLAIQEAGADAMRELRATLDVLRAPGSADESGLDRLDELVERARSAGLPATVTVTGERRDLPADVDAAAYRIVQESLTNAARHSGGAAALVRVEFRADELTVRVDDDGRAHPDRPPVPGVGLLGMRERVTALGGRLRAEPRPEGGFTVDARFPLPQAPSASAVELPPHSPSLEEDAGEPGLAKPPGAGKDEGKTAAAGQGGRKTPGAVSGDRDATGVVSGGRGR